MPHSGRSRFRIQAVSELTGVPAATLRAWERRYGVPAPARTVSAYRLYSEGDVDQVRQLRDLCARGVAPAEAAKLVSTGDGSAATSTSWATPGDALAAYRERMLVALEGFDAAALEAEARATLLAGSAADILRRVVTPLMHEVGRRWQQGRFCVAQEHLASEVLGALARDLLRLAQPADGLRTALLACFPDETHALPLYVVGHQLAQWGFRTTLLGARVPVAEVGRMVRDTSPSVVALSWTIELPRQSVEPVLADCAQACAALPWIVGGRAAAAQAEAITRHGGLVAPPELGVLHGELSRRLAAAEGRRCPPS